MRVLYSLSVLLGFLVFSACGKSNGATPTTTRVANASPEAPPQFDSAPTPSTPAGTPPSQEFLTTLKTSDKCLDLSKLFAYMISKKPTKFSYVDAEIEDLEATNNAKFIENIIDNIDKKLNMSLKGSNLVKQNGCESIEFESNSKNKKYTNIINFIEATPTKIVFEKRFIENTSHVKNKYYYQISIEVISNGVFKVATTNLEFIWTHCKSKISIDSNVTLTQIVDFTDNQETVEPSDRIAKMRAASNLYKAKSKTETEQYEKEYCTKIGDIYDI